MRFFLDALTAEDSPYDVAHRPGLNIVLVTPPPIYVGMMGDDPFSKEREPATSKAYAEVVVRLGKEYAGKQSGKHWALGTVNMHEAVVAAAGGEGEELRDYLR